MPSSRCSLSNHAAPYDELEPAARRVVDRDRLGREHRRVAVGHAGDEQAEPDALGDAAPAPRAWCCPRSTHPGRRRTSAGSGRSPRCRRSRARRRSARAIADLRPGIALLGDVESEAHPGQPLLHSRTRRSTRWRRARCRSRSRPPAGASSTTRSCVVIDAPSSPSTACFAFSYSSSSSMPRSRRSASVCELLHHVALRRARASSVRATVGVGRRVGQVDGRAVACAGTGDQVAAARSRASARRRAAGRVGLRARGRRLVRMEVVVGPLRVRTPQRPARRRGESRKSSGTPPIATNTNPQISQPTVGAAAGRRRSRSRGSSSPSARNSADHDEHVGPWPALGEHAEEGEDAGEEHAEDPDRHHPADALRARLADLVGAARRARAADVHHRPHRLVHERQAEDEDGGAEREEDRLAHDLARSHPLDAQSHRVILFDRAASRNDRGRLAR